MFAELASFVLDTDKAGVASIANNLHHPIVICVGLITLVIKVVALRADALCKGHHFRDANIAIVFLIVTEAEVTKVWKRTATLVADLLHHFGQPLAIRGQATMVLNDDIDLHLRAVLGQARKAIGCEVALLLPRSGAVSIDPDRMASEELCSIHPLVVVLNGLLALGFIRVSELAFAITHDEDIGQTVIR